MAPEQPRSSARAKLSISRYSAIFLVLLLIVVAIVYASVNSVVEQQEKRLIRSRVDQLTSTLQAQTGTITAYLSSLALATRIPNGMVLLLQSFGASSQSSSDQGTDIAFISHKGPNWVVNFSMGSSLKQGEPVTGDRLALIQSADNQVSSGSFLRDGKRYVAFAIGGQLAAPGMVVYLEINVSSVTNVPAFNDLNVAVYSGTKVDEANLVLSSAKSLPLKGKVYPFDLPIGKDTWHVVASEKRPLIGSVASNLPWILVVISFCTGLVVVALIEIVVRRRNYAMALVDERTAALQDSLDQLNRAQDQLVSSQRMAALGEMAASVGHELRNPLAVLTNSMYLVRHAVEGNANDRLRRNLDTADREIAAATLIVSDLLEFSRPRQPAPDNIVVDDLIRETLSAAPPRDGITVDVNADDVPPIVADRAQLRQVLLNLIINSYDAMPEGGNISIDATSSNGTLHIAVSDTGQGADPEQLARVFEPFWTSKTKGIGLGLAVSRRIMESHNGTIELTARPDRGCTATITLPLHAVSSGAPS